MGLLAAWLAEGAMCETKAWHKDAKLIRQLGSQAGFEFRKADRVTLMQFEEAQPLLEAERPPNPGEGPEPSVVS